MASPSAELQALIYDRLVADSDVGSFIGDRIYDGVPEDEVFPYASFGPTDWTPDDADCIPGIRETIQIDVWSRSNRRLRHAKNIADAIAVALHGYRGELPTHALHSLDLEAVQVMPDPDGETAHAVVVLTALIERVTE